MFYGIKNPNEWTRSRSMDVHGVGYAAMAAERNPRVCLCYSSGDPFSQIGDLPLHDWGKCMTRWRGFCFNLVG